MKNIEYLISIHDPEASEFHTVYSVVIVRSLNALTSANTLLCTYISQYKRKTYEVERF